MKTKIPIFLCYKRGWQTPTMEPGLDIPQTKYLLNAAYLRIKNVTLGYTIPNAITKRFKVSRLRVFVTGENLYEFSSIKKYIDPEAVADGWGWAHPYQRKYAFGINLDF